MSRRCEFCFRIMDAEDGVIGLTFYCPGCGFETSAGGILKLPDPEQLRLEAEQLVQLAEDLEQGNGLAGRLQEFTHA